MEKVCRECSGCSGCQKEEPCACRLKEEQCKNCLFHYDLCNPPLCLNPEAEGGASCPQRRERSEITLQALDIEFRGKVMFLLSAEPTSADLSSLRELRDEIPTRLEVRGERLGKLWEVGVHDRYPDVFLEIWMAYLAEASLLDMLSKKIEELESTLKGD